MSFFQDMTDDKALERVVEALCGADGINAVQGEKRISLPVRDSVIQCVEALRSVLFPGYFGAAEISDGNIQYHIGATLDRTLRQLCEQIRRCLVFANNADNCTLSELAVEITQAFMARLPHIKHMLATDVEAAYEGDPALNTKDEAILSYPGVFAITNFRLAHELHLLGVPLIPRLITEHAHAKTGVDIHPGATIGDHFFIDHATGIVIGETAVLGNNVRIYQGVTLGAKSFPLDENGNPIKGIPRHPILEDDVVVYSNATILGRITIGRGSSIGGNVWLTRSVPPGSFITIGEVKEALFSNGEGI